MRGGYLMIDLTGVDFLEVESTGTIPGIHARVLEAKASGKPIVLVNKALNISSYAAFESDGGTDQLMIACGACAISVASNDEVTVGTLWV